MPESEVSAYSLPRGDRIKALRIAAVVKSTRYWFPRGMQERGVVCFINEWGYWVTDKGALLHREILRKETGPFNPKWVVHHCNGNKLDNRPENLVAVPSKLHHALHMSFGWDEGLPDKRQTLAWLECFFRDARKCYRSMRLAGRAYRRSLPRLRKLPPAPKKRPAFKPRIILRRAQL